MDFTGYHGKCWSAAIMPGLQGTSKHNVCTHHGKADVNNCLKLKGTLRTDFLGTGKSSGVPFI